MFKISSLCLVSIFLLSSCFFGQDDGDLNVGGQKQPKVVIETGSTASRNEASWTPTMMKTGVTIETASGVKVTTSTNGPDFRPMTDTERAAFQKQILGK